MPKTVKVKKACCQSRPRCKRCPVVLARLVEVGLARPTGKRTYELSDVLGKKQLKAFRGR